MKKIILIILLFMMNTVPVCAEEGGYRVVVARNGNFTDLFVSDVLDDAEDYYSDNLDLYDNLILVAGDKVIRMEYGVVSFNTNSECTVNVEFLNVNNRTDGYINGCYGRDAAYIRTGSDNSTVDFVVSGTYGRADIEDVELIPYENLVNVSSYKIIDGELIHLIKGNLASDYYISMINLGEAPDYLDPETIYYSYDSHYFYDDLKIMLDDYIGLNYDHAVNLGNPYYNYYMYLSHRSISNYSIDDFNSYIEDYLLTDSNMSEFASNYNPSISDIYNQSQYYGKMEAFVQYQYQFGANAMMMLSLSMNETAAGRSSLSYRRNNLFGHAAYDSDVEANARRYNSIENSVYSHARTYISETYLNPERFQYNGGFFGNKESGMNVSYASDPYWGEKAASYYYQLDQKIGLKDLDAYCIGISNDFDKVDIYDKDMDVIDTTNVNNMAFVLLEDTGDYYRIQYEGSYDTENYTYDFEENWAYVSKDDIDVILNEERLADTREYKTVIFSANGGTYSDGSDTIQYRMAADDIPCAVDPAREGYLFSGYADNQAQYEKIKSISIIGEPRKEYQLDDKIDLSGISLAVELDDGVVEIPVDSSMVDKAYFPEAGVQEVSINLQNNIVTFEVEVEPEESADTIHEIYSDYLEKTNITELEAANLFEIVERDRTEAYSGLTFDEIREIDGLVMKYDEGTNYILDTGGLDLSLSGVAMSFLQDKENSFINDNLFVNVVESDDAQLKKLVENYDYDSYNQFSLQFSRNNTVLDLDNEIVVSVAKPEGSDSHRIFMVFEHTGDRFIRLSTTQTDNYISFRTAENGSFIIAGVESVNSYSSPDKSEVLTAETSDQDAFIGIYRNLGLAAAADLVLLTAMLLIRKKRRNESYIPESRTD